MWLWFLLLVIPLLLWWQPPGISHLLEAGQWLWDDLMRRLMFSGATARASEDPSNGLHLSITDGDDVTKAIEALHQLAKIPSMKSIYLTCSSLRTDSFLKLWEEAKHLQRWSFLSCHLGYDQWSEGKAKANMALHVLRNSNVYDLQAVDCRITQQQLHEMAQDFGRPVPKMTALDMVLDPPVKLKEDAPLAWNLQILDLSKNGLGGAGRSIGILMRNLSMLSTLALWACDLGLEDIEQIAKALSRSNLYRLDLAQNALGSDGLLALTRTLANSKLQSLGLEWNDIDVGDALNELKIAHDKRPLQSLRLQRNKLSLSALQAFHQSLKKATESCAPGCRCFEGRGEVM
eukprot:symbB.v1.2.000770.t1/scaffold8.1/size549585/8